MYLPYPSYSSKSGPSSNSSSASSSRSNSNIMMLVNDKTPTTNTPYFARQSPPSLPQQLYLAQQQHQMQQQIQQQYPGGRSALHSNMSNPLLPHVGSLPHLNGLRLDADYQHPLLLGQYHMMNSPKLDHERLLQQQQHQQLQQQQQQFQAAQNFQAQAAASEIEQELQNSARKEKEEAIIHPHFTTTHATLEGKKKRGRPKKLILDPETNEYIDLSHPNFKHLNRVLKDLSSPSASSTSSYESRVSSRHSPREGNMGKLYDQPTYLRKFEDEAVQQLLLKKDKRGRPRKFPVEQTGVTIKGIRVNGSSRHKILKK